MQPSVVSPDPAREEATPEGCFILESWNQAGDAAVSIARARVERGGTTRPHRLHGVIERYLIVEGEGVVRIGDSPGRRVGPGDVVVIPAGIAQQIANTGAGDLVFYCICTPRFTPECYESLEPADGEEKTDG